MGAAMTNSTRPIEPTPEPALLPVETEIEDARPETLTSDRPHAEFGQRLREAIRDAGLPMTQEQLAQRFGVTQPTVGAWLRGNKLPAIEKGVNLAEQTGDCVEWLYTGRGTKYPQLGYLTLEMKQKLPGEITPAMNNTHFRMLASIEAKLPKRPDMPPIPISISDDMLQNLVGRVVEQVLPHYQQSVAAAFQQVVTKFDQQREKQLKNVLKALSTSITQPRDPTLTVPDNESLDGSQQNVQHQGALP